MNLNSLFKPSKNTEIFDLYAKNFALIRDYLKPEIKSTLPNENVYICPLCFQIFTKEYLNFPDVLTIEHIIPEKMGGKNGSKILTCKKCNNENGKLEGKFLERQRIQDALAGVKGTSIKTEYAVDINGEEIKLPFKYFFDGERHNLEGIKKQTNPKMLEKLKGYGMDNIKKFTLTFDIENRRHGNPRVALLKIAYLMVFRIFGYTGILYPNMFHVVQQIQEPKKDVLPTWAFDGSQIPDNLLGVSLVKSPKEYRCIQVVFDLLINRQTRRMLIILPNPEIFGLNVYDQLNGQQTEITLSPIDWKPERLVEPDLVWEILNFWKDS